MTTCTWCWFICWVWIFYAIIALFCDFTWSKCHTSHSYIFLYINICNFIGRYWTVFRLKLYSEGLIDSKIINDCGTVIKYYEANPDTEYPKENIPSILLSPVKNRRKRWHRKGFLYKVEISLTLLWNLLGFKFIPLLYYMIIWSCTMRFTKG